MKTQPKEQHPSAWRSILHREWQIFLQHRTAYAGLFALKLTIFFIILRLHRAAGIRGELIPAFVLALAGIGMTALFHRRMKPDSSEQSRLPEVASPHHPTKNTE